MNDRAADTTITIGADFSGAQREAARFQKSVGVAADKAADSFRLVTRNSEGARKSLAKVSDEARRIKRQSQGLIDAVEARDFFKERTSLAGRLDSAADSGLSLGGALSARFGRKAGAAGFAAGAGFGFFKPEIQDALELTSRAESKALLAAAEGLEMALKSGREVLASTAAEVSLAFGSSPFLEDVDSEKLSGVLQATGETVQRYETQFESNLLRLEEIFENAPENIQRDVLDRISRRFGGPSGDGSGSLGSSGIPCRASGGSVAPGIAFLVGERGPELFVPSSAGTIVSNSALRGLGGVGLGAVGFGGGDDLGAGLARLTAELQRLVAVLQQASAGQAQFAAFSAMSGQSLAGLQGVLAQTQGGLAATGAQAAQVGMAIEEALGGLPEEFGFIAEAIEGPLNAALSGNIRSWGELREAALGAARGVLGGILQSEEVRGEIGELADVIDGVLNQALSGSIDSWEDLGRVALDVLQQIATEILKTQLAGQGGGGGGIFGAIGSFLGIVGGFFGGGGGGGPGSGTTGVGSASVGVTAQVPFAPQNFAGGGLVTGPGSGTSDSIPARLSNGEFVVNAASSREHRGLLEAINSGAVPTLNDLVRQGQMGMQRPARSEPTTIVIHQHFTFNGRHTAAERAEAAAVARAAGEEAVAALEREVSRGGNKAKLFGRRS